MIARSLSKTAAAAALVSVLLAGLAAPALAEKYKGKIVTLHFKESGRPPITGTVLDEVEGQKILIQIQGGQVWKEMSEILRVEVRKPPAEEFKDRIKLCKTADDYVRLARWCGQAEVKLPDERKRCLDEAVKLDPNHKEARKELGQVKDEKGYWVDEEEYYKAKGLVKADDGRWVTQEEADKIRAEKSGLVRGAAQLEKQFLGVPWAEAKPIKSKNYVLKCNSTPQVAQRYLKVMEALHRTYSELLRDYQQLYTGPSTVYIFRNREEFGDFTMMGGFAAGFFSQIDRSVRAYHGSFGINGNTDMVLAHEATHQFQHRIMRNMTGVPNWLIEGMAVYFGDGTKIRPDRVQLHVIPRHRLQSLQDAINYGRYVSLKKLLRIPRGMAAYDHGWGVIFWCLQGNNSKYKLGHKGEGKRIWDKYLRHVTTEIPKPLPKGHFEQEAKYFEDLLLKETGAKSIEEWEEGYKKFILALPLEALGRWKGNQWDGWTTVGIQLTVPEKLAKVEEKDLRQTFREAAAVSSDDGVRLWLSVQESPEVELSEALGYLTAGYFTDREFAPEFKEEEVQMIKVNGVIDVAVTSFTGKYRKQRESRIVGAGPQGGGEKKGKKAPAPKKDKQQLDLTAEVKVRAALFPGAEKIYLIVLSGPEAPFSKIEPRFDDVLKSVRLNFQLSSDR